MSTKVPSLPCKKRKTSHDEQQQSCTKKPAAAAAAGVAPRKESQGSSSTTDFVAQTLGRKYSHDCSLPVDDLPDCASISKIVDVERPSSLGTHHLDALTAKPAADETTSHNDDSFASSGHRLLMEAIMIKTVNSDSRRDRLDSINSFVNQRQRLESWGGMSELSFTGGLEAAAAVDDNLSSRILTTRDRLDSLASESGTNANESSSTEMQQRVQACVAAAMASVGDELHELAGLMEQVAAAAMEDDFFQNSESNILDPSYRRPRSHSVSSTGVLSVDLDAVQAAVDAGEAVSLTLGLKDLPEDPVSSGLSIKKPAGAAFARRQLPLARDRTGSQTSNDSKGSIPLKKRAKRPSVQASSTIDEMKTPKTSNRGSGKRKRPTPDTAPSSTPMSAKAEDRWDAMYSCLLEFAASKRHEATKDLSDVEANQWTWDGNVPTSYTTPDGNKLGRWVNNQRTAKQKGKLRPDREEKLISAGLKWFIIPPDAWDDMFEELKLYIASKTASGETWDGHVPTNYQITGRTWKSIGTDKNLGRWVNRQRDMFQNGKLKKARREKLEQLGLKWPKNAVTWDEMLELLIEYAEHQRRTTGRWDGNVPSCYQTSGDPPRLLGKWVARQRVARSKKKLTKSQEDKLTNVGMAWDENSTAKPSEVATPKNDSEQMEPIEVISIQL